MSVCDFRNVWNEIVIDGNIEMGQLKFNSCISGHDKDIE